MRRFRPAVSYVLRARRGDQMSAPGEPMTQFLGIPGNQGEGEGELMLAAWAGAGRGQPE